MKPTKTKREMIQYVPFEAPVPTSSIDHVPNAVMVEISHNLARRYWCLELDLVACRDGIVSRQFVIGIGKRTSHRLQLADAPRFNARQLQRYADRIGPHVETIALAYRDGNLAGVDAIVIAALA
jgi:hypothetical protein